jgi:Eukaryotic aspartyl protease
LNSLILAIETGLLKISAAQYSALKPLNFKIGANTYALSANGQIWPRSLNTAIGGTSGSIYLVVGDVSCFVGFFLVWRGNQIFNNLSKQIGSNSGKGLDFINGYTFLERFYSVYDTSNKRVGFATTAQTTATSN